MMSPRHVGLLGSVGTDSGARTRRNRTPTVRRAAPPACASTPASSDSSHEQGSVALWVPGSGEADGSVARASGLSGRRRSRAHSVACLDRRRARRGYPRRALTRATGFGRRSVPTRPGRRARRARSPRTGTRTARDPRVPNQSRRTPAFGLPASSSLTTTARAAARPTSQTSRATPLRHARASRAIWRRSRLSLRRRRRSTRRTARLVSNSERHVSHSPHRTRQCTSG
jgi:hypothetical protein